jgi:hypothetical protein
MINHTKRRKQRGFINPHLLMMSGSGYQIQRSLRFRGSANAYLNRTFAAGDQQKWTFSFWFKGWSAGIQQNILQGGGAGGSSIYKGSDDALHVTLTLGSAETRVTNAKLRDPSAYYHVVVGIDSTLATAADRAKVFINGSQITSFSTSNDPILNTSYVMNSAVAHVIGQSTTQVGGWADGCISDPVFVGGQQLGPSSFGEFDKSTGQWIAKRYSGTYGVNGFYLDFKDPTSLATLTADKSGNGNNFTANNVSLTADATYDSMLDVPLGAGGAERGNYCVLSAVNNGGLSIADGNLRADIPNSRGISSTIGMRSGKWYCEVVAGATPFITGVVRSSWYNNAGGSEPFGATAGGWGYTSNGQKQIAGALTAYGASYNTTDVIGIAFDADNGILEFFKNNVSQGIAATGITGENVFALYGGSGSASPTNSVANFGQRPFAYTPPTGFKALHTGNLVEPTIKRGDDNFSATTYSGNNAAQSISGMRFAPGLVWIKNRNGTLSHNLSDTTRGAGNGLASDLTSLEYLISGFAAFASDGFTLAADGSNQVNQIGSNYISWSFKAGGAPVANNSGSISSQVSASPGSGFSIVSYNGTGVNATVGHGLGVAPKMVLVKKRAVGGVTNWAVWHASLTGGGYWIQLNTTNAQSLDAAVWNSGVPTSTVFNIGTSSETNNNTSTYVAYCFAEIPNFSMMRSYIGNASADGPFVPCGFKPRYVLVKRVDAVNDWIVWDSARNPSNLAQVGLFPNSNSGDSTASTESIDILSNGFKVRGTSSRVNASGGQYLFMAIAESPFKYANAR